MRPLLAEDRNTRLGQMANDAIMRSFVSKRHRTIVSFFLDTKVLLGVEVDTHNLPTSLESSVNGKMKKLTIYQFTIYLLFQDFHRKRLLEHFECQFDDTFYGSIRFIGENMLYGFVCWCRTESKHRKRSNSLVHNFLVYH